MLACNSFSFGVCVCGGGGGGGGGVGDGGLQTKISNGLSSSLFSSFAKTFWHSISYHIFLLIAYNICFTGLSTSVPSLFQKMCWNMITCKVCVAAIKHRRCLQTDIYHILCMITFV